MQLDPAVFGPSLCRGILGNRIGRTISFGGQFVGVDPLFNQVVHHRCRSLLGKLLVSVHVTYIIGIAGNFKFNIADLYQYSGNIVQALFCMVGQVCGAKSKGDVGQNDICILFAAKLINRTAGG